MANAFCIDAADNVAVMLDDTEGGALDLIGAAAGKQVTAIEPIKHGHKVALTDIADGAAIVKYGIRIGHAVRNVRRGEWVHLHNMASDYDERSNTLDVITGAPKDVTYE